MSIVYLTSTSPRRRSSTRGTPATSRAASPAGPALFLPHQHLSSPFHPHAGSHSPSSTSFIPPGSPTSFLQQHHSREDDSTAAIFERDIESTESVSSLLGSASSPAIASSVAFAGSGYISPPSPHHPGNSSPVTTHLSPAKAHSVHLHHPIARASATDHLFPTVLDDGEYDFHASLQTEAIFSSSSSSALPSSYHG